MENYIIRDLRKEMIKHFLDIIVMNNIKLRGPLSGYDIIETVQSEFNLMMSPGSVYSLLYCLERQGLLSGEFTDQKRVFRLTDKGEEHIKTVVQSKEEILKFARVILENNQSYPSST